MENRNESIDTRVQALSYLTSGGGNEWWRRRRRRGLNLSEEGDGGGGREGRDRKERIRERKKG
ncbi:unnamed protein product [Brassica rapa]|uniref:Uncharacterized protein n=1 Tax=Brassica campestris TaxID=3711 RepID=A0A8D9HPB1_BRACM|nr:unnamed protein product [Brassica rapa]